MSRTVVGSIVFCFALAAPARGQFVNGDLYVASFDDKIYRVEPSTWNVTLFADANAGLNGVSAIAFAGTGTLLCSNFGSNTVLQFDSAGNGSTLYDGSTGLLGPFGENGMAYDVAGDLFVSNFTSAQILVYPAGGGAPAVFADAGDGVVHPDGLAFAANGDLFVANRNAYDVLRIDPSGNAVLFDTLPDDPYSIVVRGNGDIYVACYSNSTIYRYPGGDVTQRVLFATFPNNGSNPALQFDVNDSVLYLTSYAAGNLVTIDPDTAQSTEVIAAGGLPGALSIGVVGRGQGKASWSNYGAGFPGTNGVPSFTSQQDPVLGTTITLDLANSYAQPTAGLLFIGFQRADIPSSFGFDLLVAPALVVPVSFSYGFDSFTGAIPADGGLVGTVVDLQAFEADPGAAKGVSATPGLELVLGY
jgi:sugar lactone lactonase YvrE